MVPSPNVAREEGRHQRAEQSEHREAGERAEGRHEEDRAVRPRHRELLRPVPREGACGRTTVSGTISRASAPTVSSTRKTTCGSTSGSGRNSASSPPMSGPSASPPRFAAPATDVATTGLSCGRAIARSSPRWAVAVADRMPMLTPLTARAAMSPAVSGHSRNITAETIEIADRDHAASCDGRASRSRDRTGRG